MEKMSAQQEIMKKVKKTLEPINEMVTKLVDAVEAPNGDTDPLVIRGSAVNAALGPRYESISRVGDLYHTVQTREQLATGLIYMCDSLEAFEKGAETREASAAHAIHHEKVIDGLINSPDEEDPISSTNMVALGQTDELQQLLVSGLKSAASQGDDIFIALAKMMTTTIKLHQDSLSVTSRINDVVNLLSESKALQEASLQPHVAPVKTICLGANVVQIDFPGRQVQQTRYNVKAGGE